MSDDDFKKWQSLYVKLDEQDRQITIQSDRIAELERQNAELVAVLRLSHAHAVEKITSPSASVNKPVEGCPCEQCEEARG